MSTYSICQARLYRHPRFRQQARHLVQQLQHLEGLGQVAVGADNLQADDAVEGLIDPPTSVGVRERIHLLTGYYERVSMMCCRFFTAHALRLLLRGDAGTLRKVLRSLLDLCLLQNTCKADILFSSWEEAFVSGGEGASFNPSFVFSEMQHAWSRTWEATDASQHLQLSLLAPRMSADASGDAKVPANVFELLAFVHLGCGHASEELWLMPDDYVKSYGDILVSLAFWRHTVNLTTAICRTPKAVSSDAAVLLATL